MNVVHSAYPSFDNLPTSVAELHKKVDYLTEIVERIAATDAKSRACIMNLEEVAVFLGKSVSTIYAMTSKRRIPFHKRGNKLYFDREEVVAWLKDANKADGEIESKQGSADGQSEKMDVW